MQNAPNMEMIEMYDGRGIIWYEYIVHVYVLTMTVICTCMCVTVHVHVATAHVSRWDGRVHLDLNEANAGC